MATWWEIPFTGTPSDTDLEHVAGLIRAGFTSGQLIEHEAAPAPGSAVSPSGSTGTTRPGHTGNDDNDRRPS